MAFCAPREPQPRSNYTASTLPIGNSSISFDAKGLQKAIRNGVEVKINDKLTLDVKLEAGDMSTEVFLH